MKLTNVGDRIIAETQRCDLLEHGYWDECRLLGVFVHDNWYKCFGDMYTAMEGFALEIEE